MLLPRYTQGQMPRWINVANLFTLLRLILVPFVIQAILAERHTLALVLFLLAAVTDGLDGEVARRFGQTTQVGAYLDPIADKCLLSGVFLALAVGGWVPWWYVGIVFGRDIYILGAVSVLLVATSIRRFPPSVWGKVSTFVQIATVMVWMVRNLLGFSVLTVLSTVMLWVSAGFTIWSGLHYTWRGIRLAKVH